MNKKIDWILLFISLISFLLTATSFLLMPMETDNSLFTVVCGVIFWLFLIIGIVLQVVLASRRRKWYTSNRIRRSRNKAKSVGIISFFQNIPAIISDIVMGLSVIGLVISVSVTDGTGYICYVCIAVLIFSFSAHCVFNGKIYHHIINCDKELQFQKNKVTNISTERKGI